jgi:hypothetical protein
MYAKPWWIDLVRLAKARNDQLELSFLSVDQ